MAKNSSSNSGNIILYVVLGIIAAIALFYLVLFLTR